MRGVAEASEVSLKTLYNVFGNRDLLLMRVATEGLNSLANNAVVKKSNPGLGQLLAYAEGAMTVYSTSPEFSVVTIRILLQIDQEVAQIDNLIEMVRTLTRSSLVDACNNKELVDQVDIDSLATLLCAQQWGHVLMWEKGLISLAQLKLQLPLSHCLTLVPLSTRKSAIWLKRKTQTLFSELASANTAETNQNENENEKKSIAL
jgi:hypothetical protein